MKYIIFIALAIMLIGCTSKKQDTKVVQTHCVVQSGLPDQRCTPGAIFANATVSEICTPGYAQKVRNVSQAEKDKVYAEYGISTHSTGSYEVDHEIPLEIGGSNDIKNLWPELSTGSYNSYMKDKVENYLHDQVCSGKIPLKEAQTEIATNWKTIVIH
jgi:hypothetical protein